MDCKATTPISMKKKPLSKYTLNQLNKNAYVQETPHRYPYECIDKIYIATEIEIK